MVKVKEFIKDEMLYFADPFIKNPTVSVILPTYCRGDNGLLKRAIDSVLSQTFQNFELIIVDDGSVDGTENLVKSYLSQDNRILYIRNKINSGLPAIKVNQGLLHSRGKYIAYQFDDDQWPEKSLEVRIRILEQQEDLAVVYGKWEVYDTKKEREYLHEHEFSYGALIKDNYIANNAVAHHKEIINKYGMYDCHLAMRRLCDWDLWIRWGKQVPFIYIPEVVSRVEAMVENSLGNTVTYDIEASRVIFAQNRNELLTPQNIEEYSIDNLDYFNTELDKVSVYNKHMLTWELKHFGKSRYPLNGMNNVIDKNKERIIVTKLEYDATVNILVENYVQLFNSTYIYIPEQELKYSFLREGDILCLSRATSQNTLTIIQKIKNENRNISVLYFLDDDMLNVYKRGDKFNYLAPGTAMHNTVKELITSSDRVVAFSEGIANTVKQYNKKVTILKTNVLEKYLSKDDSYSENETFRIVFMGGGARAKEFEAIEDDLVDIASKYGNKVSFTFWGYIPPKMKTVTASEVNYEPYTTSYYQYMNRLSSSRFNLLLCPLFDSEFSRAKSPIKLLEACCCSTIGLYSDMPVYGAIEDGVHGYKIKDGESWFEKIDEIITRPVKEKSIIFNNALKLVKENFTTECSLPMFQLSIKSAQLSANLKKKKILFAGDTSIEIKDVMQLQRTCEIIAQQNIDCILALPSRLVKEKKAVTQSIELTLHSFKSDEMLNMEQEIIYAKQLVKEIENYNIGLIHSFGWIPVLGYVAKELNIPYVANINRIVDVKEFPAKIKEFTPDCIVTDSTHATIYWQDKLGCPAIYMPMLSGQEDGIELIKIYIKSFSEKKVVVEGKQLELVTNQQPHIKDRLIESGNLVLSRRIIKNRTYKIYCDRNEISGIGMIFASEEGMGGGLVTAQVFVKGRMLRSATLQIEKIVYNTWTYFIFEKIYGCGGSKIEISLEVDYKEPSAKVGVYEDKRNRSFMYKVLNKLGMKPRGNDTLYVHFKK